MSTPAKKAAPRSLSDLLSDEEEKKDTTTPVVEENKPPAVKEEKKDNEEENNEENNDKNPDDTLKPGSVVVPSEEGKDNQAEGEVLNNKTPAQLSSETPAESAKRFGISSEIPDAVHDNPNVNVSRNDENYQIPAGTHLHPDIARDNYNRRVGQRTEHGEVTMTSTQRVYATEAPLDDKGIGNKVPEDLA